MRILNEAAPTIRARLARSASMCALPTRHSTELLSSSTPSDLRLALVMLDGGTARAEDGGRFEHLWRTSSTRLVADGAANLLHDRLDEAARAATLPDLVTGDLDSLRGDVAAYYAARGVAIEKVAEQDTHDFSKCLRWLERRENVAGGTACGVASGTPPDVPSRLSVVAHGALGGRLDHVMANLNALYLRASGGADAFERLLLVSRQSVAFVLPPGRHVIVRNRRDEDGSCGLLPLGGRCDGVRTRGLRWDLDGQRALEFGAAISTSNRVEAKEVLVETRSPLLWTAGLVQYGAGRGGGGADG